MRKLTLTCACGQRMLVPRSAVGKMGMCPSCGKHIHIGPDRVDPQPGRFRSGFLRRELTRGQRGASMASEEAKQRFGQAVDLFYAKRYAEALSLFDTLAKEFPGNPEVQSGRAQCLQFLNRLTFSGAEARRALPDGAELDIDTVKRVVLDLLLHGARDEVRLQAAELASKLLGIGADQSKESAGADTAATDRRDDAAALFEDFEAAKSDRDTREDRFAEGDGEAPW